MKVTHLFSNQESLEQHIRNLLCAGGEGDGFIDEYIDSIFAYSSLEDYVGITDEAIWNDYRDWMAEQL